MGSSYSRLKTSSLQIADNPVAPVVTIRPRDIRVITVTDSHPLYASLLRAVCVDVFGDAMPPYLAQQQRPVDMPGVEVAPIFQLDDLRWTMDPADLHVRIDDLNSEAFRILGMLHIELGLALDSLTESSVAGFARRVSSFLRGESKHHEEAIRGLRYRRDLERLRARAGLLYTIVEAQVLLDEFPWHLESIWPAGPRYSVKDLVLDEKAEEAENSAGIIRVLTVAMEQLCAMLAIPPSPQTPPISTWEVRLSGARSRSQLWNFVNWDKSDTDTLYSFRLWYITPGAEPMQEFPFAYVQFMRWVLDNSTTVAANVLATAADQFELDGAGPRGTVGQSISHISNARDDRRQQAWYFRSVLRQMCNGYGGDMLHWVYVHVYRERRVRKNMFSQEEYVFPPAHAALHNPGSSLIPVGVSYKKLLEHFAFLWTMIDTGLEMRQKIRVLDEVAPANQPEVRSAFTASRTSADVYAINRPDIARQTITKTDLYDDTKRTLDEFAQTLRMSFICNARQVFEWVRSELSTLPPSATPQTDFPPEISMFSERNPDFPKTSAEFVLEMPAVRIDLAGIRDVRDIVAFGNALAQLKPMLELITQWKAPATAPPYRFDSRDICRLAVWKNDINRLGMATLNWLDIERKKRPVGENWVKMQSDTPEKAAMLSSWYYVPGALELFGDMCRMTAEFALVGFLPFRYAYATDALKQLQSKTAVVDPRTLHAAALPTGNRALHRYASARIAPPPESHAVATGQHMGPKAGGGGPTCEYCSALGTHQCTTCNSVMCRTHAQTHKH